MSDDLQPPNNANIEGDKLPLDELMEFTQIDTVVIDDAIDWWNEHATTEFVGALESDNNA